MALALEAINTLAPPAFRGEIAAHRPSSTQFPPAPKVVADAPALPCPVPRSNRPNRDVPRAHYPPEPEPKPQKLPTQSYTARAHSAQAFPPPLLPAPEKKTIPQDQKEEKEKRGMYLDCLVFSLFFTFLFFLPGRGTPSFFLLPFLPRECGVGGGVGGGKEWTWDWLAGTLAC